MPLQNHCIDGECGGWTWCESLGSAVGFLTAAVTWVPVTGTGLRRLFQMTDDRWHWIGKLLASWFGTLHLDGHAVSTIGRSASEGNEQDS